MKKSLIALSVFSLVIILTAGAVFAGPGGHRGHRGPGMMGGERAALGPFGRLAMLKHKLDLSDQQVEKIRTIFGDLREQNEPYRNQLRGGIQSVAATLIANPNDTAAAQKIIDQQTTAEKALKANLLVATSKALNVLTPEQRTKLGALMAERQARAAERRSERQERQDRRNDH
jgi:Spy/CpxP family protein refolding chaperone